MNDLQKQGAGERRNLVFSNFNIDDKHYFIKIKLAYLNGYLYRTPNQLFLLTIDVFIFIRIMLNALRVLLGRALIILSC